MNHKSWRGEGGLSFGAAVALSLTISRFVKEKVEKERKKTL